MKHLPLVAFAAAFGLALLAAPAAQAFTFENQESAAGGGQNFLELGQRAASDPAQQSLRFGTGSPNTYQQGPATFQFGTQGQMGSFDQRYNPSNLFDPYAREGRY
jgi:hypothetical protein